MNNLNKDIETVKETTQLLLPDGVIVSASISEDSLVATFIISVGVINSFEITPQPL